MGEEELFNNKRDGTRAEAGLDTARTRITVFTPLRG